MARLIEKHGLYGTTNPNKRHDLWVKILAEYKAETGLSITLKSLQKKWSNDQSKLKSADRAIKVDKNKTGNN